MREQSGFAIRCPTNDVPVKKVCPPKDRGEQHRDKPAGLTTAGVSLRWFST